MAVYGFGSVPPSGGSAIDGVCPFRAAPIDLECLDNLRIRRRAEGNDTDYGAAFTDVVNALDGLEGSGQRRIVYLLTDGKLDLGEGVVGGAGQPGDGPAAGPSQDAEARSRLDDVLRRVAANRIEVWPVALGADQDGVTLLGQVADAGSRPTDGCPGGAPAEAPSTMVVSSPADLGEHVAVAASRARCRHWVTGDQSSPVNGATTETLWVPLPARAAQIDVPTPTGEQIVVKDPLGHPVPVSAAPGLASASLVDPLPGRWTVTVSGLGSQAPPPRPVLVWSGGLTATMAATRIDAGHYLVRVLLTAPAGAFADEYTTTELLESVRATADVPGSGQRATLRPDQTEPGTLSGTLAVPDPAPATLTVHASITAPGAVPCELTEPFTLADRRIALRAPAGQVSAGDDATGYVHVDGAADPPKLTISVVRATDGVGPVRPSDGLAFERISGGWEAPFPIHVARSVKPGQVHGTVVLSGPDGRTVDSDSLQLTVTKPSDSRLGRLEALLLEVGLPVLVLVGFVVWWCIRLRRSRRRSSEPEPADAIPPAFGLCVWLYADNLIVDFLEVVDGTAMEVGIDVVRGAEPKLRPALVHPGTFRIRRGTEPGKASFFWAGDWKSFALNDPIARKNYVGEDGLTVEVTESALSNPEPEHAIPEGEVV